MNRKVLSVFLCLIIFPLNLLEHPDKSLDCKKLLAPPQSIPIYYVTAAGTAAKSCESWPEACDIQTALSRASSGTQIWVAQGTYKPSASDRLQFYYLSAGVSLFGGFNGTETTLSQRDWVNYPTILSGEIQNDGDPSNNSFHVISVADGSTGIAIDGFTIRDGFNNDFASGLYAYNSQATFSNLILLNNTGNQGGAINFTNGAPKLVKVTITDNHATWGGGVYAMNSNLTMTDVKLDLNSSSLTGGGMFSSRGSIKLNRVIFSENETANSGGGYYALDSNVELTDVSFFNNSTSVYATTLFDGGGGMYHYNSGSEITDRNIAIFNNVLFSGNNTVDDGGGLYSLRKIDNEMTNVTFTGNSARRGGAFSNSLVSSTILNNVTFADNSDTTLVAGAIFNYESTILATNSILWANSIPQATNTSSTMTFKNSDIQGGCPSGTGITCTSLINSDPQLQPLVNNGGFTQTLALALGSPAIDAGDQRSCPAKDQRGFFRSIDGDAVPGAGCDMGAYEYGSFLLTGPTLYVESEAKGYCTTWEDACSLQSALEHAEPGWQIWVKGGEYKPSFAIDVSNPRTATFVLRPGVGIYGGFSGAETSLAQRNWKTNPTILSGDIGTPGSNTDNTYHVVTSKFLDDSAILDGFTIRLGNANGSSGDNEQGGGLYIIASTVTLRNLIMLSNNASQEGGGMYVANSIPVLTQIEFNRNSAFKGGGMYNSVSDPNLRQVTFYKNTVNGTGACGAGFYNYYSSPIMTEAIFEQNHSYWNGGGMCSEEYSNPTLSQVTFIGNIADVLGGAMYNRLASGPILENVTISGSTAIDGAGIYSDDHCISLMTNVTLLTNNASSHGGSIYNNYYSQTIIKNSILWGSKPEVTYNQINSSVTVSYSDVDQDGFSESDGNIRINPILLPLADYGGYSPIHAFKSESPVIDTGDPSRCPLIDQRGIFRPQDGNKDGISRCDMGAYEFVPTYQIDLPLILR